MNSTLPNRSALITGITGQDGILSAKMLLAKGYRVFGMTSRPVRNLNLPDALGLDGIEFIQGDMKSGSDIERVFLESNPDELYNFASQSSPGESWSRALETTEVNALGAHRIFEIIRTRKPECRVFQASSSEMFCGKTSSPLTENSPLVSRNPYGESKIYAHNLARLYRERHHLFIACGILFNHESVYRKMQFLPQKVAYGAACAKLNILQSSELNEHGKPIVNNGKMAIGNLDTARDWGSAKDFVDAAWRMLQLKSPIDCIIATGCLHTVKRLRSTAFGHAGIDWRDHVVSDARFHRTENRLPPTADTSFAATRLGWKATTSFQDMITGMVDHHLERLASATAGKNQT